MTVDRNGGLDLVTAAHNEPRCDSIRPSGVSSQNVAADASIAIGHHLASTTGDGRRLKCSFDS